MITKPKRSKPDGPDAQSQAFKWAISKWPGEGVVCLRLPKPGQPEQACEVGYKRDGVFYVMGSATTWSEAVEQAESRQTNSLGHKNSRPME